MTNETQTHTDRCIAAAEAAGWTGNAAIRLVVDPKSSTWEGFQANLADANEMRAAGKFVSLDKRKYDVPAVVDSFVAHGFSSREFRESAIEVMADEDMATQVNTARRLPSGVSKDPYAARAAEIDKLNAQAVQPPHD